MFQILLNRIVGKELIRGHYLGLVIFLGLLLGLEIGGFDFFLKI